MENKYLIDKRVQGNDAHGSISDLVNHMVNCLRLRAYNGNFHALLFPCF